MRTLATAYRHRGLRRPRAGDLIAIGVGDSRTVLSVDSAGFSAVTGPLNIVTTCQHGTLPWQPGRWPTPLWMLHRWDHHDDVTTPHPTRDHALSQLASYARSQ